ncbi:MAG: hypothetical protein ACD_5C00289G0001 [uncultured bacterium]|nr:MAG: hypothetical protein ACD_5C00289G0001 [uncultured bacterium]
MKFIAPYAVFVIPIVVGLITQSVKFVIYSLKHGWDIRYAFTHGHMPSAHTAFAVSLLASIGFYEGIHTGTFALAVALAFLVIDDATRLRMTLGDQGKYLNMLVGQLNIDEKKFPRLKERMGHKVSEVIVGAIFGLALTAIFIYLFR